MYLRRRRWLTVPVIGIETSRPCGHKQIERCCRRVRPSARYRAHFGLQRFQQRRYVYQNHVSLFPPAKQNHEPNVTPKYAYAVDLLQEEPERFASLPLPNHGFRLLLSFAIVWRSGRFPIRSDGLEAPEYHTTRAAHQLPAERHHGVRAGRGG